MSAAAADTAALERGKYIFDASGCANCHTDRAKKGPLLGGGAAIKTPFGTFYGPNISPHPERGIGKWSEAQFIRAMRKGVSPGGRHYYPAFPYASFTLMTDGDLKDLKAYIFSLPPIDRQSPKQELGFPYNIRAGVWLWKTLYLEEGPYKSKADKSAEWNRGAYLVEALTHCGECHTPRTALGGMKRSLWLAGNAQGPDNERIPNITPDSGTGIGKWSLEEIIDSLETGTLPDGDEFGSLMADVVTHGTAKLTAADRRAIAVYLKALPAIQRSLPKPTK
ncbi:MAG: cytochrome c [Alphaproteobacteria bacterium]|nr:cytochrome c [Alphaproteobacteria bacterium]